MHWHFGIKRFMRVVGGHSIYEQHSHAKYPLCSSPVQVHAQKHAAGHAIACSSCFFQSRAPCSIPWWITGVSFRHALILPRATVVSGSVLVVKVVQFFYIGGSSRTRSTSRRSWLFSFDFISLDNLSVSRWLRDCSFIWRLLLSDRWDRACELVWERDSKRCSKSYKLVRVDCGEQRVAFILASMFRPESVQIFDLFECYICSCLTFCSGK